ncbi:MAG TPA: hypothetical protein VLT84_04265 [Acidobacteriota bacterium]|nr:hypothetical protein [Acidobacteriota bacterium]
MLSLRLVHLLDAHRERLADSLFELVLRSPECADFHKVPRDHLEVRCHAIYRDLSAWLVDGAEGDIAQRYVALGFERAAQHVALSHFIRAIHASKRVLYDFLEMEGLSDTSIELQASLQLLRLLDQFFDNAIYYASIGYEQYAARLARVTHAA